MRFSTSGFFHKSVGPRPLIHDSLFRIWPRFRGVISESVVFSCHFPGIYTRKVITFRVYIPGKSSLSGYIYSESDKFPISFFGKKTLKQRLDDKRLENFDTQNFSFRHHFPGLDTWKVRIFRVYMYTRKVKIFQVNIPGK